MKLISWNTLASGSRAKFATPTGHHESVAWEKRRSLIAEIITEMLSNADVIGLQDVDSFFWLLSAVRENAPDVRGIWVVPSEAACAVHDDNEKELLRRRERTERTFKSECCPPEFAAARYTLIDAPNCSDPMAAPYHSPAGVAVLWDSRRVTPIDALSPVCWISWAQHESFSYGYSPRRHLIVNFRDVKIGTTINVCVLRQLDTEALSFDLGTSVAPLAILSSSSHGDECVDDKMFESGYVRIAKSRKDHNALMMPNAVILRSGSANSIWGAASETLHWHKCVPSCGYWNCPEKHTEVLDLLVARGVSFAKAMPSGPAYSMLDVIDDHEQSLQLIYSSLGSVNFTFEVFCESLMCIQPHINAPSPHSPVSAEFIA